MDKLFLIGGTDSIGVPYTKDNKTNSGFFEQIENFLSNHFEVTTFNFFHMSTYNTNSFILECLKKNYSLAEIKVQQNQMLRKCKYSGFYPYLELPKNFLNFYKIQEQDYTIKIKEQLINNKNVIFLYSAGVNDFLKYNKSSLFKMFSPRNIKNNLKELDTILENCFQDIYKNISYIHKLNKDCKIYLVGLFYPTNLKYIRKRLKFPIDSFNDKLKNMGKNYKNVYFIENSNLSKGDFCNIDFHPNSKGHKKIYENFLKAYEK